MIGALFIIFFYFLYLCFTIGVPIWVTPYIVGVTVYHFRSHNWVKLILWLLFLVVIIVPVLDSYDVLEIFNFDFGPVGDLNKITSFVMLAQMVLWWYVWFGYWKNDERHGARTGVVAAFIVSALFSYYDNNLLTSAVFLILMIVTANEQSRRRKAGVSPTQRAPDKPPPADQFEQRDISDIGYQPYPTGVDVKIFTGGGKLGKSIRIEFRTGDSPDQVLAFYKRTAENAGLHVRIGTRVADDPNKPPVPALVALRYEPVALVITRDTHDEFKWTVTVWLQTWPGFVRDIDAYFQFEKPAADTDEAKERKREIVGTLFSDEEEKPERDEESEEPVPTAPPVTPAPTTAQPPPPEPPAPPIPEAPEPEPPPPSPREPRKKIDWGELVETYAPIWGTWIGVIIVVLGLGYFLSMEYGIIGKIISVYAVFAIMFGAGLFYEKKERFRVFGTSLIAGGWAGFYLTTFLIHYLPEARVITNPAIGILFLIVIAGGMILHSFKYRSQTLTTLTYFIAFITISMSVNMTDDKFFSLIATIVLAVSMLFILHKRQWYWLALFSIAGCYVTHFIWLWPLVTGSGAGIPATEYWSGLTMLILYWVTFTTAVFMFKPKDGKQDSLSMWMNAVNFFLFFFVFQYQLGADNPGVRLWIIEGLAIAYIFLSWFAAHNKRDNLYTLNLVIAVMCTTMTLYYHLLGGNWVTIGWLLQAEVLYITGLLTDKKRYRNIGVANFILIGIWMITSDYNLTDQVSLFGLTLFKRTVIAASVAIVFYINSYLRHVMADRIEREEGYSYLFSYAASILWLIIVMRNWFPDVLLNAALTCSILGYVLMEIGIRTKDGHFRIQGLFFIFIAIIASFVPLIAADKMYYTESLAYRIVIEAIVILLTYAVFYRFMKQLSADEEMKHIEVATGLFSSVVAVIAIVFLHREFAIVAPMWIVFTWMLLSILLIEIGLMLKNAFFRIQGYLVAWITLVWAVYTYIIRPGWYDAGPSYFLVQLLVIIGFFYLFARLTMSAGRETSAFSETERAEVVTGNGPTLAAVFSIAGTLILILTLQRELILVRPLFIAVAWLAVAISLLESGIAFRNRPLRLQAMVIVGIAFIFALFHNLVPGLFFGAFSDRLISLLLCVAAMYYIYGRISGGERRDADWVDYPWATGTIPWLAGILLALLIKQEIWPLFPAWVGTAWLVPVILFAWIGLRFKSANFLVQTLVLSTVIFAWTLFRTIAGMVPSSVEDQFAAQRIFAVAPIIVVMYGIVAIVLRRGVGMSGERLERYVRSVRDILSWFAIVLLVSLITSEIRDISGVLTTVLWMALAIALFENGRKIGFREFESQGYALAVVSFSRAIMVNLRATDEVFLFMSGRTAALILVAAGLYYLWLRLLRSDDETSIDISSDKLGSFMSYLGTLALALLMYKEIEPREWLPSAWSGLMLAIFLVGIIICNRRLIYQSMVLVIAVIFGVVFTTYSYTGISINWIAAGLTIGALFVARIIWQFGIKNRADRFVDGDDDSDFLTEKSRHVFSIPAALILAVLVGLEFHGERTMFMTLGFASEGLLLMIMGFALKDRVLRLSGMFLLIFSILKLARDMFVLDLETHYKVIALVGIGLILLITGWTYAHKREQVQKSFLDE